jgi:hypothetical protein
MMDGQQQLPEGKERKRCSARRNQKQYGSSIPRSFEWFVEGSLQASSPQKPPMTIAGHPSTHPLISCRRFVLKLGSIRSPLHGSLPAAALVFPRLFLFVAFLSSRSVASAAGL